jgi:CRP/FNR family transcriptional regulator
MTCLCAQSAQEGTELSPVCLGQLWIFNDLTPAEREFLAVRAKRRQNERGRIIFSQGDRAEEMFLLKSGRVKLTRLFENGNEITLDIRKAGDFIGETVLTEAGLYPVNAVCLEPVMTCGFAKDQLEGIILERPNIGLQIIRNLSAQISQLTNRLEDLAISGIAERLLRLLTRLAAEHGTPQEEGTLLPLLLTHEELGFLLGAHRVSVTRAMQELKLAGRLAQKGRFLLLSPPPQENRPL